MPDPSIISSLIGAGSSLVSNIFGMNSQNKANKTNIQLQREQNAWNEKMWNLNNEYNTPVQQVKRLKDAGLNVGLMYSNGHGDVGNSSTPAQSTPPTHVDSLGSPLSGVVDSFTQVFDRLLAQKTAESTIKLNDAKALNELSQSKLNKASRNKISFEIEKYLPSIMGVNKSQQLLNEAKATYVQKESENYQYQVDKWISEKNYNNAQTALLNKSIAWFDKLQASIVYSNLQNAISNRISANSSSLNAYYNGRNTVSNIETQKVLRQGQRIENELRRVYGESSEEYKNFKLKYEALKSKSEAETFGVGGLKFKPLSTDLYSTY